MNNFRYFFETLPWLKIGILITGIALGLLLSAIIVFAMESGLNRIEPGPFILMGGILFGGISMIIAHMVDKPVRK